MIRSIFASSYKNKLKKWWNEKKDKIAEEYSVLESNLINEHERKRYELETRIKNNQDALDKAIKDIDDLQERVDDKKVELAKVNDELKIQIRLIEAKASPDAIWTSAFSQGFSKAWDTISPMMKSGIEKAKEKIRVQEIEESIPRIDSVVEQRLKEIGSYDLIQSHMLESKRRECENKLSQTKDLSEKIRLESYIKIIDWVLGSRNGN